MKKIKCLNIISNMNDGGAQKIVLNYVNDLQKDNKIDLSLLVLSSKSNHEHNKVLENYNIKVTYLNCFNKKINIKFIQKFYELYITNKKIKKYLLKYKPDVVHVHLFGTLLFSYKPIVKCNILNRFYTLHSDPSRFMGTKLKILQNSFNKYNFIPICVTNEQANFAKKYYNFKKFEVVHNGIDFENIKSHIVSKNEARKIFNLANDDFVVCAVGRLDPIKQYDLLLKIFSNILRNKKNCKLLIAGSGNELDNLKNFAIELNISNNVTFLGNISNTTHLYCASDVLVITSKSESSSLTLLEAQTCDLKCVISSGVPNESIITNKVIKMKKEASIDEWTKAIIDGNNFEKKQSNFEDYEVHAMSNKMKEIYLKYWKECQNEK